DRGALAGPVLSAYVIRRPSNRTSRRRGRPVGRMTLHPPGALPTGRVRSMRGNRRIGLIIGLWATLFVLIGAAPAGATTGDSVKQISAGESHTCAVRTDGTAWCWGDNRYGQLGDGTRGDASFNRLHPVQVKQGNGFLTDVKNVGAGAGHTCAVKNDGTVWCWGEATWG